MARTSTTGAARSADAVTLVVGIKRGLWRIHDPDHESADTAYVNQRMRVLQRDEYTCRGCGFQSVPDKKAAAGSHRASGYLDVHHLDDDHHNNDRRNLATLCPFCHQVFHCGCAGRRDAGRIAWLPEIEQSMINLLCNAAAATADSDYVDTGEALLNGLSDDQGRLGAIVGESAYDAATYASMLMRIAAEDPQAYARRAELLHGVRLIPSPAAYAEAVEYWRERVWPTPVPNWESIYEQWRRDFARARTEIEAPQ